MYHDHVYLSDQELPDEIKAQILLLAKQFFPEGFIGENANRDWINKPDYQSIHVVVTDDNNEVISYCSVVQKQLKHVGQTYVCWGLTAVLTNPKFQKQGFGKRAVAIGTEMIKQSKADIGMFNCAPSLECFYSQNGWIPMKQSITLVGDKDNPTASDELLMMLFLSQKAITHRADFENNPIYFGEETW